MVGAFGDLERTRTQMQTFKLARESASADRIQPAAEFATLAFPFYVIIVTIITIVIVILPPLFGNLFSDSYVVNSCSYFEALDKCYLLRASPRFPEHRLSLLSVPSAHRTFLVAGKERIALQVCLPARQ